MGNVAGSAVETRLFLSSPSGHRAAAHLANLLSAYNATDDVVPFFGDHRLAHTEAYFQLQNSVCLAYHGFYSQASALVRRLGRRMENMLRFSRESLSLFGARMVCATQVSIAMLLVAFLPTATSHPDAAAGFIDYGDVRRALSVLPVKDAELLRALYNDRDE